MTKRWLVTVKVPGSYAHDPKHKIEGKCPLTGGHCTDVSGAHHTALTNAENADEAWKQFFNQGFHVTRIEEVKEVQS